MSWHSLYTVVECGMELYANTKALSCNGQLGFWSFGRVFSRFCSVQLNHVHGELLGGLYGVVVA